MKYGDLDLKSIREKLNLDFAHFTYPKNMCSCCYGPSDLASIYWKNREVIQIDDPRYDKLNYILFKNAENGSGTVTKNDEIKNIQNISWQLESEELLIEVCKELKKQVGPSGFVVFVPSNDFRCIELINRRKYDDEVWNDILLGRKKEGYKPM